MADWMFNLGIYLEHPHSHLLGSHLASCRGEKALLLTNCLVWRREKSQRDWCLDGSLRVRGREPARLHNVPSYEDKALCQSRRFESDFRKDGLRGRATGWRCGFAEGSIRGRGRTSGSRQGFGGCGGRQDREEEACTVSWRAALGCWARRQWAGPTASQPSRDSALEQRLITTCQSCFLSSLTCLHIFPNKERSCKHGNHLLWQRPRAVRAQQGPEPRPAQGGEPREEGRGCGSPLCLSWTHREGLSVQGLWGWGVSTGTPEPDQGLSSGPSTQEHSCWDSKLWKECEG